MVDVVVVYKSSIYSKTKKRARKKYGHTVTKQDAYVVLWVEWKEGVVYLLVSGRMYAEEWNLLAQEKVSLIIG